MANPYHDGEGKFCSKDEMEAAYTSLANQGKFDAYYNLRREYDDILAKEEKAKLKQVSQKAKVPVSLSKAISLTPSKLVVPIDSVDLTNTVDYDYDSYSEPWDDETDSGRNRVYEGLKIDGPIEIKRVLARIYQVHESELPQDLIDFATEELDIGNPENYNIETSMGYYGEEVSIFFNDTEGLREYSYKADNAIDRTGLLDYVRSKGLPTQGKKPIEALKLQLNAEKKNSKVTKLIDSTTQVKQANILLEDIEIVNPLLFKKASPAQIVSDNKTSTEFAGVVVYENGKNYLVDGNRRFKGLQNSKRGAGKYIVLYRPGMHTDAQGNRIFL